LRFPIEFGMLPVSWLSDMSSVFSIPSLPMVPGIDPDIALFCNNLSISTTTTEKFSAFHQA
jgi:hypothetical protein